MSVFGDMIEIGRTLEFNRPALSQGGIDFGQGPAEQGEAPTIRDQMVVLHQPVVLLVRHADQVVAEQGLPLHFEGFHKPPSHPVTGRRHRIRGAAKVMEGDGDVIRRDNGLLRQTVLIAVPGEPQPQVVMALNQQLDGPAKAFDVQRPREMHLPADVVQRGLSVKQCRGTVRPAGPARNSSRLPPPPAGSPS